MGPLFTESVTEKSKLKSVRTWPAKLGLKMTQSKCACKGCKASTCSVPGRHVLEIPQLCVTTDMTGAGIGPDYKKMNYQLGACTSCVFSVDTTRAALVLQVMRPNVRTFIVVIVRFSRFTKVERTESETRLTR